MDLMRDQISRPNKADDHSINSSSGDPDSASSAGETGDRSADGGADRSSSRDVIGDMNAARRSKTFVYLALLYAAAAVGSMIFVLTSDDEKARCQQSFDSLSQDLATNTESNVYSIFDEINTIATAATSHALAHNSSWPFVTLPNFGARASDAEKSKGIDLVIFSPIVNASRLADWEEYAVANQHWIADDLKYEPHGEQRTGNIASKVFPFSHDYEGDHDERAMDHHERQMTSGQEIEDKADQHGHDDASDLTNSLLVPIWQMGPAPKNESTINQDLYTEPNFKRIIDESIHVERPILCDVSDMGFPLQDKANSEREEGTPRSTVVVPVKDDFYEGSKVVGFVFGSLRWSQFFENSLPEGTRGIIVELTGKCWTGFSFRIEGRAAEFIGLGHQPSAVVGGRRKHTYEFLRIGRGRNESEDGSARDKHDPCALHFTAYANGEFESSCTTNKPALYATVVVVLFLIPIATFAFYDHWVDRRQRRLLARAKRTDAILSRMLPEQIQKRMMEDVEAEEAEANNHKRKGRLAPKNQLNEFLNEGTGTSAQNRQGAPIAEMFTETSLMFADIVGFTQWSSCRVPSDVFVLLEAIFANFDEIASRRRVFKVETVGDCYVAACGLPEPRKDHALAMARFARDCLYSFVNVVKQLEVNLGPDTSDLGIRIGLHSGPVTAGVLRGDKARFQLFGDTMNTCSRIETTGEKNKIHISQETAERLANNHGKAHWCRPREGTVVAKGKGELKTYWLEVQGDSALSSHSSQGNSESDDQNDGQDVARCESAPTKIQQGQELQEWRSDKTIRLVNWNAEILARKLREVVARREALKVKPTSQASMRMHETRILDRLEQKMTLDEVNEVIMLPKFDADAAKCERDATAVELGSAVVKQLNSYLLAIALLYRENAFHCFEHATHVTMSVVKLLSRVVASNDLDSIDNAARDMHDHTYGITSDPLTQFAVVFSALIHDVDHRGVTNAQLAKEMDPMAAAYNNKSSAEQNSIDIAWSLLMQKEYEDLRRAIYATPDELERFRQLVVNVVMATDIMDKELGLARKARWSKVFSDEAMSNGAASNVEEHVNRKATIVIEHIIQASDVAHTMQHWNIYRKWNTRFFEESYKAYTDGRADKNPSDSWYDGELGFFDFYIIPLARKLKDCGVFGVSGDEYLVYAQQNRREWESRGRQLVVEMLEAVQAKSMERIDF